MYVLLDIIDGKAEEAVRILRSMNGVAIADLLDARPDVIVMLEAPDRQRLAELIMPVIGSVDEITQDLHLLVTRDGESPERYFVGE